MTTQEGQTMTPESSTMQLQVDAAITITDPRTGTRVRVESYEQTLAMLRQRHHGQTFTVGLDHTAAGLSFIDGASRWRISDETVAAEESNAVPTYLFTYESFWIKAEGQKRPVKLDALGSVARAIAAQTDGPVTVTSELLGFIPETFTAENSEEVEDEAAPQSPVEPSAEETPAEEPAQEVSALEGAPAEHPVTSDEPTDGVTAAQILDTLDSHEAHAAEDDAQVEDAPQQKHAASDQPAADDAAAPATAPAGSFAEAFAAVETSSRRQMKAPAEEGWRGSFNRTLGLKLSPGAKERELRQLRATVQQGLPGARTAMFCNVKGGVSKTTSTFGVAATMGRVRGRNVLAWDNNENSGDLVERGQTAPHHRTAIDLVGRIHELDSLDKADQLAHYLHPQGDNRFEILASQEEAATKQIIDAEAFRSMHAVLKTFYSPILVDTGNASTATTWQAALEAADVVVVVIENASNAVRKAATTLDTIREAAGDKKVSNAVIMLTGTRDPSKARRDRIHEVLAPRVRSIVDVPWDPSLKEGNDIIWELLQPKTREAYLRASAAIIEGM